MNLSSRSASSRSASSVLAAAMVAGGALAGGAIAPAQAASSLFTESTVNQDSFLVMAAPRANEQYNLVVVEQKPNKRACWQDNGNGTVEPLLLDFNFSGICGRATDSNGYSIRMAGEDLGLKYSLRLVNKGDYVSLVGTPSNRRMGELEIGRTQVGGQNFLAIDLNPGWELSRRVYDGKALGHMYFSNQVALADTIAQQPTRPAQKPVTQKPVAEKPSVDMPVAGSPLPTPPVSTPVAQAPVEEKPVIIEVVPIDEPTLEAAAPEVETVAQVMSLEGMYSNYQDLNALYNEVMGRNIDPLGLYTYNAKLESGKSLDWVRDRIMKGSEYKAMAKTTVAEMQQNAHYNSLNALYTEVFGRSVDASGLATYSRKLDQGKDIAWVRTRLQKSEEGRAVAIDRSYVAVLGRHVDPSGMETYLRRMKRSGWSVAEVQQALANSDEAKTKVAQR